MLVKAGAICSNPSALSQGPFHDKLVVEFSRFQVRQCQAVAINANSSGDAT